MPRCGRTPPMLSTGAGMQIDLDTLNAQAVYALMIQTIVPRPVAWVLTENPAGGYNLAPFSYFNAVASAPPLIMLSVGRKPDGERKDTRANIERGKDFIVHIAHREMLEALNASAASLPPEVSEVEQLGLELAPMEGSRLPRLAACRVAMACELYQLIELGDVGQGLILGRVRQLYVDDAIAGEDAKGRLKVHAPRLDPIGRLGGGEYVTFGELRTLERPR